MTTTLNVTESPTDLVTDVGWVVMAGSWGCEERVPDDVTDPPGVTTVIVLAVENGELSTKVMVVASTTEKVATSVVPIFTLVAPRKFVPVIVTVVP